MLGEGTVRRITSINDIKQLVQQGYLTSFADEGEVNSYVGLRPVKLMLNCPVIAHPSSLQ